jgi:succinate-semialdehyde dehydrogenase/glutarate-semialdehyde dehydrogenase
MYDNLLANVPTDLWIGGKWKKASDGGRFDVIDPATEKTIASVASATVEDAKAAVDAAQNAFVGWAGRKPRERGEFRRARAACGRPSPRKRSARRNSAQGL